MARRPRVVVIGAGIIGTSIASSLAACGASVTVIEAGLPGEGTTSTSLAWVNASSKVDAGPEQLELALRATAEHHSQANAHAQTRYFHPTGGIDIRSASADADHLKTNIARLQEAGYSAELLPARELAELEPVLKLPAAAVGAYYADEAWVDGPAMARALLKRARRSGAKILLQAPAKQLVLKNGTVRGVALARGAVVRADTVVIATGRWTQDFLAHLEVDVPLADVESQNSRAVGLLATVRPTAERPRTVLHGPEVNWAPRPSGYVVLASGSADRAIARDRSPESVRSTAAALVKRAAELSASFVAANLEQTHIGLRALPIDGRPVCGWVDPIDGVYVVATHSGITLAPLLSRLVAKEIVDEVEESILGPFRPSRFDKSAGNGASGRSTTD
jgi:glycine/D-amino acid oxidase-like deaminating enzyme